MGLTQGNMAGDSIVLLPWNPQRQLREVSQEQARYSRGFLRSQPGKWFPGFTLQWLPLVDSLGIEVKSLEVQPLLSLPNSAELGFAGAVDGEDIAVRTDADSARFILDAVAPGSGEGARSVILEYLARRFLKSLSMAWTGPESSEILFDSERSPNFKSAGLVKFAFSVNGNNCTVWVVLGRFLVDRLDGLWRRQIQSTVKADSSKVELHFEVAQLAVPPSLLADYTKRGAIIDLEVVMTDHIILRIESKPWLQARMCNLSGNLGFEILAAPVPAPLLPDGSTRVAIEFGAASFDASQIVEMAQAGSTWDTGIKLEDKVKVMVNGQKVADAELCLFEGRFAIAVV